MNSNCLSSIHECSNLSLYEAIRPRSLKDYVGQQHLLDPSDGSITSYLRLGYIPSMILYGPSGVGKTTLARVISNELGIDNFIELSATTLTVSELKPIFKPGLGKAVVFIDEIHRLNKIQQNWLLPYMEDGSIVMIGSTTIRPSKRMNKAILSRCAIFELNKLSDVEMTQIILAATSYENQRRTEVRHISPLVYEQESMEFLTALGDGDSRRVINIIELVSLNQKSNDAMTVTISHIQKALNSSTTAVNNLDYRSKLYEVFFHALGRGVNSDGMFWSNTSNSIYDDSKSQGVSDTETTTNNDFETVLCCSQEESDSNEFNIDLLKAVSSCLMLVDSGEPLEAIFKKLIEFAFLYLDYEETTIQKLLSVYKSSQISDNIKLEMASCIEWLMHQHRSSNGCILKSQVRILKNYLNKKERSISNYNSTDEFRVSFNPQDLAHVESSIENRVCQNLVTFEIAYEA